MKQIYFVLHVLNLSVTASLFQSSQPGDNIWKESEYRETEWPWHDHPVKSVGFFFLQVSMVFMCTYCMQICSQPQWNVEWLFTKLIGWVSYEKSSSVLKGKSGVYFTTDSIRWPPNNGAMDWITSDFSLKWMGTVNRGWDYYSDTFPRSLALHLTSLALPHCSPCRSSSAAVRP